MFTNCVHLNFKHKIFVIWRGEMRSKTPMYWNWARSLAIEIIVNPHQVNKLPIYFLSWYVVCLIVGWELDRSLKIKGSFWVMRNSNTNRKVWYGCDEKRKRKISQNDFFDKSNNFRSCLKISWVEGRKTESKKIFDFQISLCIYLKPSTITFS